MIRRDVIVTNAAGIHARPAAMIVKTTCKFQSEIIFTKDDVAANAKSIMNLLLLAAEPGAKIMIEVNGSDEMDAMDAVIKLFEQNFNDDTDQTF